MASDNVSDEQSSSSNTAGAQAGTQATQGPVVVQMDTPRDDMPSTSGTPPAESPKDVAPTFQAKKLAFPFTVAPAQQLPPQVQVQAVSPMKSDDVDYIRHLNNLRTEEEKAKVASDKSNAEFGIRNGMVQAKVNALEALKELTTESARALA